jgi:hypothetical protein
VTRKLAGFYAVSAEEGASMGKEQNSVERFGTHHKRTGHAGTRYIRLLDVHILCGIQDKKTFLTLTSQPLRQGHNPVQPIMRSVI